jgi:hypothetical protein
VSPPQRIDGQVPSLALPIAKQANFGPRQTWELLGDTRLVPLCSWQPLILRFRFCFIYLFFFWPWSTRRLRLWMVALRFFLHSLVNVKDSRRDGFWGLSKSMVYQRNDIDKRIMPRYSEVWYSNNSLLLYFIFFDLFFFDLSVSFPSFYSPRPFHPIASRTPSSNVAGLLDFPKKVDPDQYFWKLCDL